MAIVPRFQCDLCGYVWTPTSWEDNANGGELGFSRDGINNKAKIEHLCRECRGAFYDAFREVQAKRLNCRLDLIPVREAKND